MPDADRMKWMQRHRELIGRFIFEFVIIVIGVTAAFALEAARQERADENYRLSMIAAMIPLLEDFDRHNRDLYAMDAKLAAFDGAVAAGKRPRIPIYRERGSERAPTRAWDGIVATGLPRSLPPTLFMGLSLFFTRQDSLSERYVRYITFAEAGIEPFQSDPRHFYDPATGELKPAYAGNVHQLRGIIATTRLAETQAHGLRAELQALQ